jgi:tetratricopeptide (TPR) repeat protein
MCTAPIRAYITLKGELVTDSNEAVPGTRIAVAGGPSDITGSKGNFQIRLPNDFIEGERVVISVFKKGWVINHPLDGEWNLPNIKYQDVHTTRVIIVPRGSKTLWNHARIEKHIAMMSDELAKKKQEGLDFSYYLNEWAEKYGFTPDQVKAQFDEWAEAVKNSDNKSTKGLRYFYLKDLPKAAEEFEKAALQGEEKRKALKEKLRQVDLDTYENWKYSGNALYAAYEFREALEKYRKAEKIVVQEDFPRQWGEIQILLGNAESELGIRVKGEESYILLSSALASYRRGLEVYRRKDLPQDWAMTQNNLGTALSDLGIRTGGKEGAALLAEAVQAYRNALEVRTKKDLPQDWAMTQNNLGNALQELGIRTGGKEGAALLARAVQAYGNALEVRTKKDLPQQWATTQNNLGNALSQLGIRTGGKEGAALLARAVQAYGNALEVRTFEHLPLHWAQTQNNLAKLYESQDNWPAAIDYYQNVYKVYPRYVAHKLATIYHDKVFRFEKSLEMNLYLVNQDSSDRSAQLRLVESYFTTGRFKQGNQHILRLKDVYSDPSYSIIAIFLKVFEIANFVGLNETGKAADQLEILIDIIGKQSQDFKLGWEFTGTKYFIQTNKELEPHEKWLLSFFTALEKEDRNAIIAGLTKLRQL